MNKFFKIHLNWRINVLVILAMVVTILLASDCENLCLLFTTKLVGFHLGYLAFRLGKYWDNKGKIPELMELANEEE